MKWIEGRQGSGYEKMKIFISDLLKCDMYLLRFKEGSYIDTHTDPVKEGWNHYRINIVLQDAIEGGEFVCENAIFRSSFINFFRPDIHEHAVTRIDSGVRYVLSFGWIKRKKV